MKNIDPIVKGLGLTQPAWNKQGKHTWLPPSCSERRYASQNHKILIPII
jgi:hypothetical protein